MNFFNKKQVCKDLQISGDTFQAWVSMGLPEYRIGRIILVKKQELDAFIESHSSLAVDTQIKELLDTMK